MPRNDIISRFILTALYALLIFLIFFTKQRENLLLISIILSVLSIMTLFIVYRSKKKVEKIILLFSLGLCVFISFRQLNFF